MTLPSLATLSEVMAGGRTLYARNGDIHLAYQVLGNATDDLLLLEADFIPTDAWEEEGHLAHAIRRLASFSRLIRCDRRGIGCSDPITPADPPTLERAEGARRRLSARLSEARDCAARDGARHGGD